MNTLRVGNYFPLKYMRDCLRLGYFSRLWIKPWIKHVKGIDFHITTGYDTTSVFPQKKIILCQVSIATLFVSPIFSSLSIFVTL